MRAALLEVHKNSRALDRGTWAAANWTVCASVRYTRNTVTLIDRYPTLIAGLRVLVYKGGSEAHTCACKAMVFCIVSRPLYNAEVQSSAERNDDFRPEQRQPLTTGHTTLSMTPLQPLHNQSPRVLSRNIRTPLPPCHPPSLTFCVTPPLRRQRHRREERSR